MKKYALIPTRYDLTSERSSTTQELHSFLSRAGWEVHFLVGESSIFEGVSKKCKELVLDKNDLVILCHDDIQILWGVKDFNNIIRDSMDSRTGFLGLAGTPVFGQSSPPCKWWAEQDRGALRGVVGHGDTLSDMQTTYFGPYGKAVVMDGVFLCAEGRVFNGIQLSKPKTFSGDWDFYDIFYTFQAHLKGLDNKVIPLNIRHESLGFPRPEWEYNRQAFVDLFGKDLPAVVS